METRSFGITFTYLSKVLLIYAKHEIQLCRVIFQDPLQRVVVFAILQEIRMKQSLKM